MKRRNLVQVALVLVLAVVLYPSSGCQYTPPGEPEGQLLVILSRWGGGEKIPDEGYELLDLHGRRSDVSKTLGVFGVPSRPAVWSPNGDRLAYRCSVARDSQSWIFDVDIATMIVQKYPLPEEGYVDDLVWSADGKGFLFTWGRGYPEPSEIWQLDRDTQQITVLSQLPAGVGNYSWSPDQSRIAFVTAGTWVQIDPHNSRLKDRDLYIQNVDGTGRRMMYEDVTGVGVWSPDTYLLKVSQSG
jgi:Tol biopolymer transport system component